MHRLRASATIPLALALALVAAPSGPAAGQATRQLQPTDAVHRALERLAAWGAVDTVLMGQRPWSRHQAARMTAEALAAPDRLADQPRLAATAENLLAWLTKRLAPELARLGVLESDGVMGEPLLGEIRVDGTWTDSPSRGVPSNVVATTAARLNPLVAYDLGRGAVQGASGGFEAEVGGRLGEHLAASVRPRVGWTAPDEGPAQATARIQSGQLRWVAGNAALTVGRAHVLWGQGPRGGLTLSTNPPALLMASLATEDPVWLVGPLARLGPSRHQIFLADMGTEGQTFPHSRLVGIRSSFLPHPRVEVGIELLVESGGEGAPDASFTDLLLDHLFLPDLFLDRELVFSNKLAGLDARLRVPGAAGLELYLEMVLDDIDIDRFGSMLWQDGSWTAGLHLARVNAAGTLGLRVEGQHTGLRFYAHGDFMGGLTVDRHLLGSELGPDANGLTVQLDWDPAPETSAFLMASVERRGNDPYRLVIGTPYYFARLGIRPKELRWRAIAGWERPAGPAGWRVRVEGGYEHVEHFAFSHQGTQHNLMARTVVGVAFP